MKKYIKILILTFIMTALATACVKISKVEDNKSILSNSVFKIEMPSRFDGLYDTVVKDNAINLYDLECKKDGYEGWAFGIYAYENPADWAGGPIEKVGELKISSGKIYDIVIAYPSESQFGFDREMPEKYKNLYDARYEIAGNVYATSGEKVSIGEGTKGENLYKEQIKKHLTSLTEKWEGSKLEDEGMSPIYMIIADGDEDVLKKVGFAYKDINLDGIDELLVGEIANDEWKGIIYDLYTMVDRKPKHVFSGWDRNRYYAMEGGFILNEGSGGAGLSETDAYTLTSNSTELFFQFGCKYDEYENKDNPWFISYDSNEENRSWENSTEEQVNEMKNRLKRLSFDYTPFEKVK